jgi:hypothetical protein
MQLQAEEAGKAATKLLFSLNLDGHGSHRNCLNRRFTTLA